jgi:SET domain-containing protein
VVIRVASSPIHGRGVFATRTIRPGTQLGEWPTMKVGDALPDHTLEGGHLVLGEFTLVNHDDDPNCDYFFDAGTCALYARRLIEFGEELTIDYGEDYWR